MLLGLRGVRRAAPGSVQRVMTNLLDRAEARSSAPRAGRPYAPAAAHGNTPRSPSAAQLPDPASWTYPIPVLVPFSYGREMTSGSGDSDWRSTNRARWDERVPAHAASAFYDLDAVVAGRDDLRPWEDAELGSLEGLDVVHLQCHIGTDTVALARRGARVVGLDFSQPAGQGLHPEQGPGEAALARGGAVRRARVGVAGGAVPRVRRDALTDALAGAGRRTGSAGFPRGCGASLWPTPSEPAESEPRRAGRPRRIDVRRARRGCPRSLRRPGPR